MKPHPAPEGSAPHHGPRPLERKGRLHADLRSLFDRDAVLSSDWYRARLDRFRDQQKALTSAVAGRSRPSTSTGVRVNAVALGTTTITFSASGIPSASATVVVSGPLGITTAALPNGVASTAYSAPVVASGGTAPYAWTATGLPPGVSD